MDTYAPGNMLPRGQEVTVEVDRSRIVIVTLAPGEASLHHVMLFHGSEANLSTTRRVGYAIRYVPTNIKQLIGRVSATLVRGTDRHGHFDPERAPVGDFDDDARAMHAEAAAKLNAVRLRGVRT